ncbi:MAG TPA: alanine--tRNA ligase [Candidatus Polarisedimenticolia bacterium]|nr:alanine--tRNA ligase [Candidatus Polarisedimenticolia bacterium]
MTGSEIRQAFLRFFESKGHQPVASSSLIPAQDPTLLFTNAGMNQFKDVFLGKETRGYRRAASSQKCMRVSGKHNDLEQVGRTPRHHTFFEMLGNFSFGDYFKKEAIAFAWELLTSKSWFGLDPGRLWITVFRDDDEAASIWEKEIGVPRGRIARLGEKDNFWSMGDTGPCGPCSEIHIDRSGRCEAEKVDCDPGHDCGRFMELWNLVFMQYDRQADGRLEPLRRTGVDTGMGLERIASVLEAKDSNYSNYDTDLFTPIIEETKRLARTGGGWDPAHPHAEDTVAFQVIADHVRAMTFLMSDGAVPSNEGRGYVLRRIMRRAIMFGRHLGLERPFLGSLSGAVIDLMGEPQAYPELLAHREMIAQIARREEERFAGTLAVGLQRIETLAQGLRAEEKTVIPGDEAFRLYDTFGLPLDLIRDVAQAWNLEVDETAFQKSLEEQRERSRRGMKETGAGSSGVAGRLPVRSVEFRGYETTRLTDARILALVRGEDLVDELRQGEEGQVLLDRTPFYAEGGGQVGDSGFLTAAGGVAAVRDTRAPWPGLNLHTVALQEGRLRVGDTVVAEVDRERRAAVMRSHDATHLVHAALRDVVGMHVKQAGSLVSPDRFRFDFSHFAPLSEEILRQVEDEVNDVIRQDLPILASVMPIDEALRRGALAFFGDKYGDTVRVIEVPGFSMELCGGTHAASTGSIGLLKLTQERGIAAGVRRLEALAGEGALRELREDRRVVEGVQAALNVERRTVPETLRRLLEQNRALQREVDRLKVTLAAGGTGASSAEVHDIDGVKVLVPELQKGLDKSAVRALVDKSRERLRSGVIVQWALQEDRVNVTTSVSTDLTARLNAGEIVKALAPLVDGRGGGRADMAEAGGRNLGNLEGVRARTLEIVEQMIRGARESR